MSTEEIIASAMGKLLNWVAVLVASYFWLVINHIRKDINGVAENVREAKADIQKLEEITTCLKINLGKIEQKIDDMEKLKKNSF